MLVVEPVPGSVGMNRDERVELAITTPVSATFFLLADDHGLTADDLADATIATSVAAAAITGLDPWTGQFQALRESALREVPRLRSLVAAVLADRRNEWWFAPPDRQRQVTLQEGAVDLSGLDRPDPPNRPWEAYAQRSARRLETSTQLPTGRFGEVRSGMHAELFEASGDWIPTGPLAEWHLRARPDAEVYEVRCAQDWHALVLQHADTSSCISPNRNLQGVTGLESGPTPEWNSVARRWEGVHLTFFGVLTAVFGAFTADGVTTTLWTWRSERTHWFRDVFTAVETVGPIPPRPEPRFWPRR